VEGWRSSQVVQSRGTVCRSFNVHTVDLAGDNVHSVAFLGTFGESAVALGERAIGL
jgi:hypothetical protein